ncbi:MFS transporter [Clostridium sp. DMHC 10]|uniref:MFS transporter n=1 Tax=Clostridium sp. DMHC 10 TaxID=747377 RepID=UPI0006C02C13|nr:MFS transporter [Clostridium sp. DMHC 10]KOF58048.1 MFS transporter [Clostridium sp. DMHC 10]
MKKFNYKWVILVLSFLGLLSVQGTRSTFGAFLQPWETAFSTNRETMSLIAMLSFVIYGISQPIIGKLIDRYSVKKIFSISTLLVGISTILTYFAENVWHIAFLYAVIASIGFGGASGIAATVAVTEWFQEKRGFALGIINAGSSAGQLILVPSSLLLINRFGWKPATLALGLFLTFFTFPILAIFFRSASTEKCLKLYKEKTHNVEINNNVSHHSVFNLKSTFMIIKSRRFWFLAIPYLICGYTTTGLMDTHLISLAHGHGYSETMAGTAVSLLAAFNILGTLLSGFFADRWNNRKFLAGLYIIRAISIPILFVSGHNFILLLFSIIFGFVDFATIAPTSILATNFYKGDLIGYALGLLYLSHQIGSALGAYIPGLFFQITGNYNISLASAIVLLICCLNIKLSVTGLLR